MPKILIIGAGKIGSLITCLLAESKDYDVILADIDFKGSDINRLKNKIPSLKEQTLDVTNKKAMDDFLGKHPVDAVISCLPYFLNCAVVELATKFNLHYFDLTEDVSVTDSIKKLAKNHKKAFVPQCGIAPGFTGIVANHLMQHFKELESVKLRVGALPQRVSNSLHYALTWSTEGLLNEYANPCHVIENGESNFKPALHNLEEVALDGRDYEAFNTSGGLGSLAEIYEGKVKFLNYKTLRYPGHCEKMRFLMEDLQLKNDRKNLKSILEKVLPKTYQDEVIIYVSVNGKIKEDFIEESYFKKIYPVEILDLNWSAIQIATAAGLCSVFDLVMKNKDKYHGFVYQEEFPLEEILKTPYGKYFS